MNQLAMNFDAPRARRRDPATSHKAAERAKAFAPSHAKQICAALSLGPDEGMTAEEISESIGLTVVQIDRRVKQMQRDGLICVRQQNGIDVERNGFRVLSLSTPEKTKPAVDAAGL